MSPGGATQALTEPAPPPGQREGGTPLAVRFLLLLVVLFVFFISINLMGSSLKALTKTYIEELLRQATENPIVGLLLGILTTSIIQSSSTTTSIVVTFTAIGMISLQGAIPIIMGANIGTTVTNTLVSFTHVRRKAEFERALAAGTVHDFFNILAVLIFFPLEIATGILEKSALWIQAQVMGAGGAEIPGLKEVVEPVVKTTMKFLHWPSLSLVVSLILLFVSLTSMVKIMRAIFIHKMARILDRFLFRNAAAAMLVGVIFTVLVQSSSVSTSLVVPLVGAGILTVEQIFPYTLGANVGTTVTAFLAALAIASSAAAADAQLVAVGLTVAIVHLCFNIYGIALVYIVPPLKTLCIVLSKWLARVMTVSPSRTVWFLILYFVAHIAPLVMFLFL